MNNFEIYSIRVIGLIGFVALFLSQLYVANKLYQHTRDELSAIVVAIVWFFFYFFWIQALGKYLF